MIRRKVVPDSDVRFVNVEGKLRSEIITRGNQQPAAASAPTDGIRWYRAMDGGLINLDLAQQIQVYDVDGKFQIIASYNDGSEVMLADFGDKEQDAWQELDRISGVVSS